VWRVGGAPAPGPDRDARRLVAGQALLGLPVSRGPRCGVARRSHHHHRLRLTPGGIWRGAFLSESASLGGASPQPPRDHTATQGPRSGASRRSRTE
jgi:hypothetical protein